MESYKFKIAYEGWEFEQIHKLNYQTFVEEIPQHERSSSEVLIDKFHKQNKYIICINGNELLGMIAVRDRRPFSLDCKLENLDQYLPCSKSLCEIRLLSIKREKRNKRVIKGLFSYLADFCESNQYDLALISATTNQQKLYNTLGFKPFGPLVGTNEATYQPMYLTRDSYLKFKNRSRVLNELKKKKSVFLPGPVEIKEEVKAEFNKESVSHRSNNFVEDFNKTKGLLCKLTNSNKAQILMGSGTLANDVIATHLSLLDGMGFILSNGEFGNRLRDHALRSNLDFDFVSKEWGEVLSVDEIESKISKSKLDWLWFVHCETSTGVLNNLDEIKNLCIKNSIKLCVDCISSIGTLPIDLEGVYLASGASGKGLASYPGLCFVFHNHEILPKPGLVPRYFDIGCFQLTKGVPFTISSNLLYSLKKSLEIFDVDEKCKNTKESIEWIEEELNKLGLRVLAELENSSPALITFALPENLNSEEVGSELEKQGFLLSYRSEYLLKRNLMQIALMGEFTKDSLISLISVLHKLLK